MVGGMGVIVGGISVGSVNVQVGVQIGWGIVAVQVGVGDRVGVGSGGLGQ